MDSLELSAWNAAHPVGTRVLAYPASRDCAPVYTKIRSAAWVLPSGHAVVLVEQRTGGIALTHIDESTEPAEQHDAMMRLQLYEQVTRFGQSKLEQMVKHHLANLKGVDADVIIHALANGATVPELTEMVFTALIGEFGENLFKEAAAAYETAEDMLQQRKGGQSND